MIIPCRNEVNFIDRCLSSVMAFEYIDGGFEVLVLDGKSTDGTWDLVRNWAERFPNLHLIDNPGRIVPTALNLGIRASRGRLIVRLDAYSQYPPDYLRVCVDTIKHTGSDNVGGLFITLPLGRSLEEKLVQAITTHGFGVGNSDYRLGGCEGFADTVPFGCYRREVFDRIGWFDERLVRNQDYEFNRRLLHAGGRIWRNPAIRVYYYNQSTLIGLLRQGFVTGQWNPWMWYLAPYSFASRHAIPGFFVLGLIVVLGLIAITVYAWAALAFIIISYFSLAIVASWQQARRHGFWMLPLLPFLFFAYHVAYGIGILWGTLKLIIYRSPVQNKSEPWPGAGRFRAWSKDADPQKQ